MISKSKNCLARAFRINFTSVNTVLVPYTHNLLIYITYYSITSITPFFKNISLTIMILKKGYIEPRNLTLDPWSPHHNVSKKQQAEAFLPRLAENDRLLVMSLHLGPQLPDV